MAMPPTVKIKTKTRAKSTLIRIAAIVGLMAVVTIGGMTFYAPTLDVTARAKAAQAALERARQTRVLRSDPYLDEMPLPKVTNPARRKALFIAAMLPLVARENARIEEQRARATRAAIDSPQYAALAHAYGLEPDAPRARLLEHIDIVPAALALAQSAIESAWGTSRFARAGNAYFGERTYDPNTPGLLPTQAPSASPAFKVKSFASAAHSVRSYMRTLNTHPAYTALRQRRAQMRAEEQHPTGLALAPFLKNYAEIGDSYPRRIAATIRVNALSAYNGLRPAP